MVLFNFNGINTANEQTMFHTCGLQIARTVREKYLPVQPLPLIILSFGFEQSYSAGRPLSGTYQLFHPESILTIPRQLMVWPAYVLESLVRS